MPACFSTRWFKAGTVPPSQPRVPLAVARRPLRSRTPNRPALRESLGLFEYQRAGSRFASALPDRSIRPCSDELGHW
jgi:hypothetical protein